MKGLLDGINDGVTRVLDRVSNLGGEIADKMSSSYDISVTPNVDLASANIIGGNGKAPVVSAYGVDSQSMGNTVNINMNTKVYRTDEDLYATVPILMSSARREARMMGA